ncbi:hypothetical protein EV175_001558 [Coemansia sp. RSA 1933]|nr:hypothetical protein EV175_001558 [Coemansia sp. RSA 1933]
MRRNILGLAAVSGLAGCASGCGPAVHSEAAERAQRWFDGRGGGEHGKRVMRLREILDRQGESLQAGVTFPDWGYGCLSMDAEAEEAHWTPFLEHGITHVRETYREPYSAQGEQLVAFLLGVASHMVADELWHSLSGLRDGFMQTLANSTFGGDYGQAHSVLDVGADFAMAHMSDLRFMRDSWAVPMADIAAIYARMGIGVSQWKMRACVSRQFYAMEAVKRFGRGLFPTYAAKAPMLTERLDDYVLGGLYSMATRTNDCWHTLVDWFADGNFSTKCLVSDRRHSHGLAAPTSMLSQIERALNEDGIGAFLLDLVVHKTASHETDGVLYLSTTGNATSADDRPVDRKNASGSRQHAFAPHHRSSRMGAETAGGPCSDLGSLFPRIKQLYTTSAYSGFGTAVATGDFSGSGRTRVAISAPYYRSSTGDAGAVFVLDDWDLEYAMASQDIADTDAMVLHPPHRHTNIGSQFSVFGSSMAVVDFNADGIDDLVVGSSGTGADPEGSVLGRVDVYLGRKGLGLPASPDITLTADQLARHTGGKQVVQRIGGFLFGEDVNGDGFADLLIGAPYSSDTPHQRHAGRLYGYISHEARGSGASMGPPDFAVASPDPQPFEWFGFSATMTQVNGTPVLLVGAPGHNSNGNASLAGKVYAFSVATSPPATTAVQPRFDGLEFAVGTEKTQLGSCIHVWNDVPASLVLLGSPSEHGLLSQAAAAPGFPSEPIPARGWQSGEVRILDPQLWPTANNATRKDSESMLSGLLGTIQGTRSPGHFGRSLASSSGAELWIGEPISESEDGRIYRWRFSDKDITQPECFFLPNAVGKARLGQTIKSIRHSDKELLVVTAPHDSVFSRLSGSVLLMERPN